MFFAFVFVELLCGVCVSDRDGSASSNLEGEHEGSILFGLPGSRQQKFLVLRFFDVKEQQAQSRGFTHGYEVEAKLGAKQGSSTVPHHTNIVDFHCIMEGKLLTWEDVMAHTKIQKKIKERSKAKGDDGEGLYVRGRTDRRDSHQSRGKSRSKSRGGRLKCYICQSEDHLKRNCPKNNRKKSTGYVKKDDQPSSSGSTYDDSEVMMVMSTQAQALLDLIMDSGCSYHMTPRLDIFFDFLECDGGSVQLGDNRECKIRGIGKVRVQLRDGSSFVLNNVRVILSGIRRDNCVYSLDGHAMAGELNASVEEKDSLAQVWHKRLGHMSEAGLQVLEKQGLFGKKSLGKLDFYENYVLGKSHRVRRVWVYILRFKHKAFGKFKEWKQLVENQTGRTVKKLRTDNGLEFYNWEFEQLCIESGIARHLTVAGMPQQNGVAERMNRTLMDKVRCLLIQSGLPKTFWAEATCTAAYLINRSPSTAIEKKTPMEMWSGHPSDYGMLRIFGCVAYPHDKQGKLEPRAIKCVLLGYPEGVKGYRLYRLDGESPKIVTSRNVVFNESVMYKDTLKDSGAGDKSVEELQVEVELQRFNNHTPEEDQIDQEDGDDEDAGDHETDQTPDLTDYQLARDRERRTRTKPLRFRDESNMAAYAFAAAEEEDTHEPLTYQEAVACEDSSKWKAAMEEEMDSLRKNKTWELVDHPAGQKLVSCKWLFKIKEGIEDYELEQLDVKTAFLHGNLKEVIYMKQPPGYEQGNKEVDEYMLRLPGFKRSCYDSIWVLPCFAFKKEFDMKELGEAKKILGMEIVRNRSRKILRVLQSGYVSKILNNFRINNGKSVQMPLGGHFKLSLKDCPVRECDVERMSIVPYANAVGSLMYLMVCTRPDIAYAVSVVSTYLANPGKNHWEAVKWILKYLRGTVNLGLVYGTHRGNHVDITGFVDSDYTKDPDKGRGGVYGPYRGCEGSYLAKGTLGRVGHGALTAVAALIEVLEAKTVKVLKVGTEHNAADALTKVVPGRKLQHCLDLLKVGVG
ncbi:retrotransposon protein, putative, ty1-copia subclass [Tanacetum coccineum]